MSLTQTRVMTIYDHDAEDQSDNDVTIREEPKYEESMHGALDDSQIR